jgi:excinuclease UvrABC nuclease subunit
MEIYIYKLIDPRNDEVRYVGKTINIKNRYKQHLYDKRKSHKASWVQSLRQIKLKPKLDILEICNENNWKDREKYWINQFNNLTNLKEGGGSDYIRNTLESTKEKLRLAHKGRKLTNEWKYNQCLSVKNRIEVIIDGIKYPSIKNAAITIGISQYAVRKHLGK